MQYLFQYTCSTSSTRAWISVRPDLPRPTLPKPLELHLIRGCRPTPEGSHHTRGVCVAGQNPPAPLTPPVPGHAALSLREPPASEAGVCLKRSAIPQHLPHVGRPAGCVLHSPSVCTCCITQTVNSQGWSVTKCIHTTAALKYNVHLHCYVIPPLHCISEEGAVPLTPKSH